MARPGPGTIRAMTAARSVSRALALRVPPLALVLLFAAAMWLAARALPAWQLLLPWRMAWALLCVAAGAAVTLAGVLAFRRARTTVNPTTPHATTVVVDTGIYRRSRNPMYLGMALALLGWSVALGNIAGLPLLAVFIAYMTAFQIRPEERALEASFGAPYRAYRARVRRWL